MNAGQAINLTIGAIALEHYLPAKRRRRRANTVDGYENSIRLHVLPQWGEMRIPDIAKAAVQEWVDGFADDPGSGKKAVLRCTRAGMLGYGKTRRTATR